MTKEHDITHKELDELLAENPDVVLAVKKARMEKERAAAYATRDKDPARWQEAKHAYAAWRTEMRRLEGRPETMAGVQTENGEG